MRTQARVATVVLNYLHADDTVACVEALQRSTCLDQRIIVVDNDAPGPRHDALAERLTGQDVVCLPTGGNLGYAGGNNVGLRLALERDPEFVWLVNPDLLVGPGTLERLLATARAIPDAGALGPRIVFPGEPARIWFDGGIFDRAGAGATAHTHNGRPEAATPTGPPQETDYVTGACLLLRTDAVRRVGLLPEDYFLYFEETHYCRAVADDGWRLIVDRRARAVHDKRSSGDLPTPTYVYYMRRNKELFAQRMGLDPAAAVAEFDQVWTAPWRRNIATRAPGWLDTFDALVALATADARAGVTGRGSDLTRYPPAEASAVAS